MGVSAAAAPPFGAAELAPPDVDLLVQVRGLDEVWPRLERTAIGRLLAERIAKSELGRSWERFAEAHGEEPRSLAFALLGKDAVWMAREAGDDGEQWVLLSRVEAETKGDRLAAWRARPLGGGQYLVAAEGLVLAEAPPWLLVASAARRGLFDEVLQRAEAAGATPAHASLQDRLEPPAHFVDERACISAYLDRAPWVTQPTLATVAVGERGIAIELDPARPEQRPGPPAEPLSFDRPFAQLAGSLQRDHLAVVFSAGGVDLPLGGEWLAALPEAAVTPALGSVAGPRRIWVLGETCGGRRDPDRSLKTPAVAFAVEVHEEERATNRLEHWAESVAVAVNRRFADSIESPVTASPTPWGGRVDLEPLMRSLSGGHPLARRARLVWTVAADPDRHWAVVASEPAWLRSIAGTIESHAGGPGEGSLADRLIEASQQAMDAATRDPLDLPVQQGWVRGDAVAEHLRGWCRNADRFASPERCEEFKVRWNSLAEWADSLGEVQWTVVRSPSGTLRTSIQLQSPSSAVDRGVSALGGSGSD